jgi:5-formyltetrahydrofolate cyclo-ligase
MSLSSKQQLRRHLRKLRRELPLRTQQNAAHQLCARILLLPQYRHARHIAFYWPADGEMDLRPLMRWSLRRGKHCYLPVIRGRDQIIFRRHQPQKVLHRNRYGIPEPGPRQKARPLHKLDIVFLPLVGFDKKCNRLGMGAGFYDRALEKLHAQRPLLCGIAYELQRVDHLPTDPWDIPLDLIATEKKLYRRRQRRF